jgi:rubrerythrin
MATENCVPNRARLGGWKLDAAHPWESWGRPWLLTQGNIAFWECRFCGYKTAEEALTFSIRTDRCPNCHRKE